MALREHGRRIYTPVLQLAYSTETSSHEIFLRQIHATLNVRSRHREALNRRSIAIFLRKDHIFSDLKFWFLCSKNAHIGFSDPLVVSK